MVNGAGRVDYNRRQAAQHRPHGPAAQAPWCPCHAAGTAPCIRGVGPSGRCAATSRIGATADRPLPASQEGSHSSMTSDFTPGSRGFVAAIVTTQVLTQIGAFTLLALLPGYIERWHLSKTEA